MARVQSYDDSPGGRMPRWLLPLAVIVLGPVLWQVYSIHSDNTRFEEARADVTGKRLFLYVQQGGRHVDEARELGWRTNFSSCEQKDTEQCWKDFLMRWPGTPRHQEVRNEHLPRAALKKTPDTEAGLNRFLNYYPDSVVAQEVLQQRLPRAALQETPNTYAALHQFRSQYPGSAVDAEAQRRLHELFVASLDQFQQHASPRLPQLVPFMRKLLAHVEATGSSVVLVRLRNQPSPSLRKGDARLQESAPWQSGRVVASADYFSDAMVRPIEPNITRALARTLQQLFPSGMLLLRQDPQPPDRLETADVAGPTLDVVYTAGWSGGFYKDALMQQLFVGIQFDFNVSLRLPREPPLRFSFQVRPQDNFSAPTSTADALGNPFNAYNTMAHSALRQIDVKLREVLLRPDSQGFVASEPVAP